MWISKKTFQDMRRNNIAQNYNLDVLKGIIKSQKQLNKCLVARIEQLKQELAVSKGAI